MKFRPTWVLATILVGAGLAAGSAWAQGAGPTKAPRGAQATSPDGVVPVGKKRTGAANKPTKRSRPAKRRVIKKSTKAPRGARKTSPRGVVPVGRGVKNDSNARSALPANRPAASKLDAGPSKAPRGAQKTNPKGVSPVGSGRD